MENLKSHNLKSYITDLLANGKYFFSKPDALAALGLSQKQFQFQAYRLSNKILIKKLFKDFFMIIPPEYRHMGSLPPHWIIDPCMKYLNQEYYIGLLSAASLYGATEQQPMRFQVITNKPTKSILLDRTIIEFHIFKQCALSATTSITVPSGYAKISTREQTLVDLVRFHTVAGHLSNVAAIIKILSVECTPIALEQVAKNEITKPVLQRLGYILEITQFPKLAHVIETELVQRKPRYVSLFPDSVNKTGQKNERWKLILNDTLELE